MAHHGWLSRVAIEVTNIFRFSLSKPDFINVWRRSLAGRRSPTSCDSIARHKLQSARKCRRPILNCKLNPVTKTASVGGMQTLGSPLMHKRMPFHSYLVEMLRAEAVALAALVSTSHSTFLNLRYLSAVWSSLAFMQSPYEFWHDSSRKLP